MPEPKWRIVEEDPPAGGWTHAVDYTCPNCGQDALLPVQGLPIAQLSSGGVIFDPGPHSMPKVIECRNCRRQFERAA